MTTTITENPMELANKRVAAAMAAIVLGPDFLDGEDEPAHETETAAANEDKANK